MVSRRLQGILSVRGSRGLHCFYFGQRNCAVRLQPFLSYKTVRMPLLVCSCVCYVTTISVIQYHCCSCHVVCSPCFCESLVLPTVMGFPPAEYVFNSLSCRGLTLTSPAAFTNTTRTSSIPGTTPTCRASCVPGDFQPWSISWVMAQVATTITAATVVVVVNNRTNVTRTTTEFNTELAGYSLPETNSAGTKVTTLTLSDYLAKTNITTVM